MCYVSVSVPVLTSLAFFGLKGAALGSATSFSLPFLLMGLREGALLRDGSVAWKSRDTKFFFTKMQNHLLDTLKFYRRENQKDQNITLAAGPGDMSSNT